MKAYGCQDTGNPAQPAVDWAQSGAMWLTGRSRGAPQLVPGTPATAVRTDLERLRSVAETVGTDASRLPDHRLLAERAALCGLSRNGRASAGGATRLLEAADGVVAIALARDSDLESVPALTEMTVGAGPWDAMAGWCARTCAAEVVERATLLGMAAARLPTESLTAPPDDVCLAFAGPLRERELNVVDLSALWAGPLAAHLLQLLGARVIDVESPRRPDPTRETQPAFYNLLHAGTEHRVIDFHTDAGRDELRRLLESADLVIEAARSRALQQLGIDAEQLAAEHGVAWVSLTAYGRADPRIGFGDDVAVAAGLVGDGPVFAGDAIADPITGVHAALVGYVAALSGRTGLLEVSMRDCVARTDGAGPDAEVVSRDGDWYVDDGASLTPVARPTARTSR